MLKSEIKRLWNFSGMIQSLWLCTGMLHCPEPLHSNKLKKKTTKYYLIGSIMEKKN